jgi:hypothetical protein
VFDIIKLPSGFIPPLIISRDQYLLEVLSPKHNELDFEAWTSSRESLKGIFGPRNKWPGEVGSLDHNLKDLENHLKEFEESKAFTYSILSLERDKCLGCLYIRPILTEDYSCRVDFWFRDDSKEHEDEFYLWLQQWLEDSWKLVRVCFPGRSISWNEYYEKNANKSE